MNETFHRAVYDLGTLLKVYTVLPAATIVVAAAWLEFYAIPAFVTTALLAFALGQGLEYAFSGATGIEGGMGSGVLTVSVGWFLAGLLTAVPLSLVALTIQIDLGMVATPAPTAATDTYLAPVDAAFEGMSGVTGSGFSMVTDPGDLPRSLQWWRSLAQWVGGIGVIVLAAAFISSEESHSFTAIHGNMAPTESIRSTTTGTAAALWWLLALFTVVGALWLWLVGMGPWAALNHSMTGVTTGGFTITENSIAAYDDPLIELATIPLMVIGAVSFSLLFFLFRGDDERVRRDAQLQWLAGGLAVGVVAAVAVVLISGTYDSTADSIRYGTFQLVSGHTSAGFQTDPDLGERWTAADQLVVTFSMIVGGAAGSTAGGLKVIRLRRIVLDLPQHGMDVYDPEQTSAETAGGASEEFDTAAAIAFLWFVVLLLTSLLALAVLPEGYTTANVLFEVASLQGNVGLSAGIVEPDLPVTLKVAFMVAMWAGRLEIVPVVVTGKVVVEEVL